VKGIVAKADIINYYFQDLFLKAWSLKGRRGKKTLHQVGFKQGILIHSQVITTWPQVTPIMGVFLYSLSYRV